VKKERKVFLTIIVLSIIVMMVTATVPVLGKSKLSNQDTFNLIKDAKKTDLDGLNVVEILGGFGVTARINNTGASEKTNTSWEIYFCSGRVFIGGFTEGTVNVPAGGETTINSGLVLGFGPGSITVTAGEALKIVRCFILGPFILNIGPYP